MIPGTQILYVPLHADGDEEHPDVEAGFVERVAGKTAFCRFWRNGENVLRTRTNSEGAALSRLVARDTRPQWLVDIVLRQVTGEQS